MDEDALNAISKLPVDETLSPLWANYIKSLTESLTNVSNVLREECSLNEKSINDVKALREEVAKLKQQLDVARQWQNTVYVDMQRTITEYQQYIHSMTSYMGYQSATCGTYPNFSSNPPPLTSPMGSSSITDANSKVVAAAAAMPYGDSPNSKTIAERKRFKQKPVINNVTETNNCVVETESKYDVTYPIVDNASVGDKVKTVSSVSTAALKTDAASICTTKATVSNATEIIPSVTVEPLSPMNEDTIETICDVSPDCNNKLDKNKLLETSTKSIEEMLRETAESVVSETGFIYDENSGQYYDWNLKMYYDPETQLYFDHENGIYYYYDSEKGSYIFHSQVEVEKKEEKKTEKRLVPYDSDPSDGEIISDEETVSENETAAPVELCIRVIVLASDVVDSGRLFMITYKGGTIGQDPACTICIPDNLISQIHNYIIYDSEEKIFYIQDNQTQSGTFLNKERIAESETSSEPIEITHRDIIQIGNTTMSFHVHSRETCQDCEPGNIQALIAKASKFNDFITREDIQNERKHQTKKLRKIYGINPEYFPKSIVNSTRDRAGERRKEYGMDVYENSDRPVAKASVVKEIPSSNKGRKMLSKMGWKSGEGLGKSGTGITDPITIFKLGSSEGLGSGVKIGIGDQDPQKSRTLAKTRQRYNKCK